MADCELDESASQPAQTPDDTTPAPCAPDDMSTDRMDTDADSAADGATHSSSSAAAASPAAASTSGGASTRVSAPGSRPDGRLSSELRPLSVEHSPLSRADGSAHWSSGGTSVLVGVYGPLVTGAARDEKHDRATIVVNFKAPAGMANNIDIERGSYIRQAFEPLVLLSAHPRCKIQITVQVLRDGGSVLAAALNATTMALIDAGVQCTAILAAVSIAVKEADNADGTAKAAAASSGAAGGDSPSHVFLLDPVSSESETCDASATFAFASTSPGAIVSVVEAGAIGQQAYFDGTQLARAACAHVQQFMKISLERRAMGANTDG